MKKTLINRVTVMSLLLFACFACKKDLEKPQWDTNILAPFAYTEMGVEHIVTNGAAQSNPEKCLDLFIRDTLYSLHLDSLVSVVTPSFDITRTLDSIKFSTPPIVTKITLGQIARQMLENPSTAFLGG